MMNSLIGSSSKNNFTTLDITFEDG